MSPVPVVGPLPVVTLDGITDTTVPPGVRIVAVRRPNVPLVQLRLHFPLGDVGLRDTVPLRLLPKMLLAGTGARSGSEIAASLQRLGILAGAGADVDHLSISAGVPADSLTDGVDELVDIVAHPSFPRREVLGERERVVQEVLQEAVDPIAIATHALSGRLFPRHPYSDPLPEVGAVRRTGRARLSRFHTEHVVPAGCLLVAVGDVDPERLAVVAQSAFARFGGSDVDDAGLGASTRPALPVPAFVAGGQPALLVHRPGAVQSNLRVGVRCADRHDPAFPALFLAATVFGGQFTSRLVDNLRERHGYTYSPRAGIEERQLAASFVVKAEVGTEVTGAALNEVRYELARMATTDVTAEELESARRYVNGVLAMAAATQAGLAGMLGAFVSYGLEPTYLERFTRELAEVDARSLRAAAERFLGPAAMTTVVVGDAEIVTAPLEAMGDVTVVK